jgi:branched-chain amino acid transport system substrate-binding protein
MNEGKLMAEGSDWGEAMKQGIRILSKGLQLWLILAITILASCAPKPVHIGFVGPLTGSSAPIGLGGRNGFLMALGDGPGAAPGKVPGMTLVVKDDHNEPETCLETLKELKAEGCSIVILGTTSRAATLALPWAMKNDMFVISPTISTTVPGIDNSLFMRINVRSSSYGSTLARLAMDRYGKGRVAVLSDMVNADYVQSIVEGFTTAYTGLGGIISFSGPFNSRTGRPTDGLQQTLLDNQSDGLLIVAASTEVALIAKELEKGGTKIQLFLPPWPLTLDLLENGGTAVEGAVAVSAADLSFRTQAGKKFKADYMQEYGETPSFTAMLGYETSQVLRSALSTGAGTQPQQLREKILQIGAFDGIQGPIRFAPDGNAERDIFLYKIKNGTFESID